MGTLCSGTVNNYTNSTCTLYLILLIINVPFWEEKITDPVLTQSVELTLIGQIKKLLDTYPVLEEVWIQIFVKSIDEFHI